MLVSSRALVCTTTIWIAFAPAALHAQGVATDSLIDSIIVTGERDRARIATPNTAASQMAEDLRSQNLVNPEDALRYVPNLTIRKRYIGDRNALIGGRSFSTLQAPRGLVFMDGYLISNFLGRFDAPRWNMIAPEEIERIDVLYGPFSAIYPGNSIGTTVVVTTRKPEDLELGLRTTGFAQNYDEYGLEDRYSGYQLSGYAGDRLASGAWWSLALNRQDAVSHPMQYYTVFANAAGQFPPAQDGGSATSVTGVVFDRDPQGRERAVFGASGGAIDQAVQNQVKLRAGYDIGDQLEVEGFAALWDSTSETSNRTFMRDAQGAGVWSGRVIANGLAFNVPSTALAPATRTEQHAQWGATLRTTRPFGWNGSLVYSQYAIREDETHQANNPDPIAVHGGAGTIAQRDGTGWRTFELQVVYAPASNDWLGGEHSIALGYHQNEYQLENPVYDAGDWRGARGVLLQDVFGETRLRAVYLQDVWSLDEHWSLTWGLRYEDWSAFDGGQRAGVTAIAYADRSLSATSPKASVAFDSGADWTLRLSVGRGVRFPTVAELFQGTATSSSITVNDPDLDAEVSDSIDLTLERTISIGHWRATLFEDDVRDSIFSQTNIAVSPSITNVQNIDRVRSRGVELAFAAAPFGPMLSVNGNVAYVRTRILENQNNPTYVGNHWPRVPDWRGNLQATWRPTSSWMASGTAERGELKPFDRNTLARIERAYRGESFWLVLWDLECTYCVQSLRNLAAAQRARPALKVVTIATDSIGDAAQLAERLTELGVSSEAYAFADGAPESLRYYAIDPAWLGEKPRAYRYEANGARESRNGVINVAQFR
jgi:iron complex outermembrane recepter protein